MHHAMKWHREIMAKKVVEALIRNNFLAEYASTKEQALEKLLELIHPKATVGIGGSYSLQQIKAPQALEERGNFIFNHGKPDLTQDEIYAIRRQQLTADVFITSTNAITMDGKLVNVDGIGNRVAAMIFGPKRVVVVCGINKIVKNVEEAHERIKRYAAPINCQRLNYDNPCGETGFCVECKGSNRICNITTILHKKPRQTDIHIIVVGEELGF